MTSETSFAFDRIWQSASSVVIMQTNKQTNKLISQVCLQALLHQAFKLKNQGFFSTSTKFINKINIPQIFVLDLWSSGTEVVFFGEIELSNIAFHIIWNVVLSSIGLVLYKISFSKTQKLFRIFCLNIAWVCTSHRCHPRRSRCSLIQHSFNVRPF